MIIMTEYFILADSAPSLAQPCERLPFLRAQGPCQHGEFLTDYWTSFLLSEGNYGHVFKTTTAPTAPAQAMR